MGDAQFGAIVFSDQFTGDDGQLALAAFGRALQNHYFLQEINT
jgi:hypothetical protein